MVRHSPDQSNSPSVPLLQYHPVTQGFLCDSERIVAAKLTALPLWEKLSPLFTERSDAPEERVLVAYIIPRPNSQSNDGDSIT